mgnify:CR=1 FL=1
MKKIFSLMAILLVAMFVTACGGSEPEARTAPSADVNALCKAYLQGDEASLKKFGSTPEEYEQQFLSEFSSSFTSSSGLTLTPEQLSTVNTALRNLLARSTFEVADVSEEGDNATVKVTVSTLTMFNENDIIAKLPANVATLDETARMDAIVTALVEILNEWQYTGTTDFDVACKYDSQAKAWLPVELEQFGVTIAKKIFGIE